MTLNTIFIVVHSLWSLSLSLLMYQMNVHSLSTCNLYVLYLLSIIPDIYTSPTICYVVASFEPPTLTLVSFA